MSGGQERMHRMDKIDAEGNFQEGKLEGRGIGASNEGRKDHGFGLGTIWDDGEKLSWRPGGKNEIEEDVEVVSAAGKKKRN